MGLFIHSFIPLAGTECDDSLLFSGASSIPVCYIPFPSTLLHQPFFHPPSLHLAIYFLTLVDFQLDAQNSYLFTYNTFIKILYMFRALPCSSSGGLRRNCIYAVCGIVTVCRWLSCAPVKKEFCASSWKSTKVILRCTVNQSSRSISWSTSKSCCFQIHIYQSFGNSISFHSLYVTKPWS